MKISDENRWEAFANDNAEYYVSTKIYDYPVDERKEIFFRSGREFTSRTLTVVEERLPDKKRALEIGAGVGRLTLPHAKTFDEVVAVDISQTMLEKLESNAMDVHLDCIKTFLPQDNWDDLKVSYAYSYLVFQHIEEPDIIENYIKRIAGCLENDGIAQLQFDTRNQSILYKLRNSLPDFLLPQKQRKGIRRIRQNAQYLRNLFTKYKLEIESEMNKNSENHIFILKK